LLLFILTNVMPHACCVIHAPHRPLIPVLPLYAAVCWNCRCGMCCWKHYRSTVSNCWCMARWPL